MSAATLKPIRLECYLPRQSGANKVSLFRAESLVRHLLQCKLEFECCCNVAICMDTHVGLNVATRVCMYTQTNVGLLRCVGCGSNVAVP